MFARPLVILFAESESSCRSHLILGRCFGQPLSFCSQAFFLFVNALSRNGPPNRCTCFSLTISRWLNPRPNAIKECRMTANCVESDHCHCRASLRKRPQKIHPRVSYQPVQLASLIYRSGTAFGIELEGSGFTMDVLANQPLKTANGPWRSLHASQNFPFSDFAGLLGWSWVSRLYS